MNIKELYRKFRAWQKEPRRFSDQKMSEQHCACCGHDYTGKFCPVCGQAEGDGRITWSWLRKSILLLWGMDSRSMPYTIWQLIWRPGYLIGEYISGCRQVSYPPVKMIFIVVVIYAVLKQLLGLKASGLEVAADGNKILFIVDWLVTHPGWGMIFVTMNMILPTWILFRYAPKHTRHTLPESAFIQIFMSTLMLVMIILSRTVTAFFMLLIPFYYYITYRQLFGYGRWSTLWRTATCFLVWTMTMLTIIGSSSNILAGFDPVTFKSTCVTFTMIAVILAVGYWIGRKKHLSQQTDIQQ